MKIFYGWMSGRQAMHAIGTPVSNHDAIEFVAAHALFYWAGGLFDYKYQRLWGDGCVVARPDPRVSAATPRFL
jgi:hypothetical protein